MCDNKSLLPSCDLIRSKGRCKWLFFNSVGLSVILVEVTVLSKFCQNKGAPLKSGDSHLQNLQRASASTTHRLSHSGACTSCPVRIEYAIAALLTLKMSNLNEEEAGLATRVSIPVLITDVLYSSQCIVFYLLTHLAASPYSTALGP